MTCVFTTADIYLYAVHILVTTYVYVSFLRVGYKLPQKLKFSDVNLEAPRATVTCVGLKCSVEEAFPSAPT